MTTCTVEGCCKPSKTSSAIYCVMHYDRHLTYGSTELPPRPPKVVTGSTFDAEELRALLDYDPETGVFVWRPQPKRKFGKQPASGVAGKLTVQGYLCVHVYRKSYPAHRLAWLHYYGEWPKQSIDHINGQRDDNRIANLRDVAAKVNNENRHRPRKDSRSGILGVNAYPNGRFTASIKYGGKQHHLGTFGTASEAQAAYLVAKAKHHPAATTGS